MIYESMMIKTSKLVCNNGQIEGVSKNPRIIKDIAYLTLKESIQNDNSHLFTNELKVFELNGKFVVISGNMRLRVCKELNIKEVPCKIIPSNWTVAQIQKEAIVSNVAAGEWDTEALANEWFDLPLAEWGLTAAAEWDTELETELQAKEDDYEEPENIKVDVFLGDLIEIGEHRLVCGDSTCSDTVARLMNGEKADMVFTDPPFDLTDLSYTDNLFLFTNGHLFILNSEQRNVDISAKHRKNLTRWYAIDFRQAHLVSNNAPMTRVDFVAEFRNSEKVKFNNIFDGFTTLIECAKIHSNKGETIHKQEKKVELPANFISHFSNINNIILDFFIGSGSTMVASHQLKRKCYGIELEPKYCQVVIDRMMKLDPLLSVKINGVPYSSTN